MELKTPIFCLDSSLQGVLNVANVFSILQLPQSLQFGTFVLALTWIVSFVGLAVRIGVKST